MNQSLLVASHGSGTESAEVWCCVFVPIPLHLRDTQTKAMPQTHTTAQRPLPLALIIPLAHDLARKESHRDDDIDDLIQVGLWAYHKAEKSHLKRKVPVQKPWALARTTIQRGMRAYYWQQREWQTRGEPNKAVGFDQVGLSEYNADERGMLMVDLDGRLDSGTQAELLEFDDYFTALQKACGPVARQIVENLLSPSGECSANILAEVEDKRKEQRRAVKRPGSDRRKQPRGVKKEIRISHRLVRDAMRIAPSEWSRHMINIRAFTAQWMAR